MESLGSLIGGHGCLKTIRVVAHGSSVKSVLVRGASKVTISWDDLAPPPFLQRFECSLHSCIVFYTIPKWVGKLGNLCILKISVRELMIDCIDILRGLPALATLSLYVQKAPIERIIFDKAGFSVLKHFKLRFTSGIAWLTFEAGAMPNLWKMKLVFDAIPPMDQHPFLYSSKQGAFERHQRGTAIISVEPMPELREMSVKFGGAAADLEYAMRTFVRNHPSNPTTIVQLVDHSSYGDGSTKQRKQQPDEILEEEPSGSNRQQPDEILTKEVRNYDKIFERVFERPRISRSPLPEKKRNKNSRPSLSGKKKEKIPRSFKSSSLLHFPGIALKKGLRHLGWIHEVSGTTKGGFMDKIGRGAADSVETMQSYATKSRPSYAAT